MGGRKRSGCVTNEEAAEIISKKKLASPGAWEYLEGYPQNAKSRRRKNAHPLPKTSREMVLSIKQLHGPSIPGVFALIVQTERNKKVQIHRMTCKLFKNEDQEQKRVVDLDVVSPLPKNEAAENWPHIHIGQARETLSREEAAELANPEKNLKKFLVKTNTEMDEEIEDLDISSESYKLK